MDAGASGVVGGASTGCCSLLDNRRTDGDEDHDEDERERTVGDDTNAEARPIFASSNMQLPMLATFILRVGRGLLLGVAIMVPGVIFEAKMSTPRTSTWPYVRYSEHTYVPRAAETA